MHWWFLLGVVFGGIISSIIFYTVYSPKGMILRIDHSNPEKDIYRLDIGNLDDLTKRKRILLDVDNSAHLSHE